MNDLQHTTQYIRRETKRPDFCPFPLFLMELPLSMTARVLYAIALNRAMLSQHNGWTDEQGRVYILFPESEMCAVLHKGQTTVKTVLRDLTKAGLLEKVPQPHGRANRLFVKVIPDKVTRKRRDYSYEGEDSL